MIIPESGVTDDHHCDRGYSGGSTLPSFGGWSEDRNFVFSECVMDAWGATIEADYPIRIEKCGFLPDTGGAAKFRGGVGLVREYRVLTDDVYFGVRSDKNLHPPHGLFGGGAGSPSRNLINPGNDQRQVPSLPVAPVTLHRDDVLRHEMAGGGGYGDPLDRDPALVLEDLLDETITPAHARAAYGVVVSDGLVSDGLDSDGVSIYPVLTERLRAKLRAAID